MKAHFFAAAALFALGTNAALAHVTLETQEAAVGSTYKAVLPVPHGCAGKASTAVVQACGEATERWIEIPAEGQDADALENPAPGIKLPTRNDLLMARPTPGASPTPAMKA